MNAKKQQQRASTREVMAFYRALLKNIPPQQRKKSFAPADVTELLQLLDEWEKK